MKDWKKHYNDTQEKIVDNSIKIIAKTLFTAQNFLHEKENDKGNKSP